MRKGSPNLQKTGVLFAAFWRGPPAEWSLLFSRRGGACCCGWFVYRWFAAGWFATGRFACRWLAAGKFPSRGRSVEGSARFFYRRPGASRRTIFDNDFLGTGSHLRCCHRRQLGTQHCQVFILTSRCSHQLLRQVFSSCGQLIFRFRQQGRLRARGCQGCRRRHAHQHIVEGVDVLHHRPLRRKLRWFGLCLIQQGRQGAGDIPPNGIYVALDFKFPLTRELPVAHVHHIDCGCNHGGHRTNCFTGSGRGCGTRSRKRIGRCRRCHCLRRDRECSCDNEQGRAVQNANTGLETCRHTR